MSPNNIDAARARIAVKRAQREKEGDSHFGPESNLMDLRSDEVDTVFDPLLNKATGLTGSVAEDVNTLISPSNHESHHTHAEILSVNENEPLMQKYPFDRKALVLGKTKLILMKNELGEGIKFITLTYQKESKNKELKLLRFSDGKNMFYWNGEQFNGNRIKLQRYVEEYGLPTYPECDLNVRIHDII